VSGLERLVPAVGLVEEALTGDFTVHGEAAKADCVIGFSFGYRGKPEHPEPGLSNEDLATVALRHYAKLPKIFQVEIATAYETAGGVDSDAVFRIAKHHIEGEYLDTREVAVQAKEQMDKRGWRTALILAHPNHMPRADAVCRALGIETVVPAEVKGAVEFDPQSTQKWTRDLTSWREYEPEAIELYRLKGWL
jgi:uncharacterized SAM-binding protein YcdF (DUF218 family)